MMRRQSTELRRAIGIVAQKPAHRWCALCRCLRVVESLDQGRKRVCLRDPTVQVDWVSPGVLLDRFGVLVDRVCSQVLQLQTSGVQHRYSSATTTVGSVGTLRIARIHAGLLAEQRDYSE